MEIQRPNLTDEESATMDTLLFLVFALLFALLLSVLLFIFYYYYYCGDYLGTGGLESEW